MNSLKERVEKALANLENYCEDGKIYFKENDTIFWLPTRDYQFRKTHWKNGLSIGAYEPSWIQEERLSKVRIEVVYSSCFCTCFKITDPDNYYGDGDIILKRSLQDVRDTRDIDPWNGASERNNWLMDFAIKVRDRLREGLKV